MMIVINFARERDVVGKQTSTAGHRVAHLPSGEAKPVERKDRPLRRLGQRRCRYHPAPLLIGLAALLTSSGVALFALVVGLFGLWLLPHVPQEIGGALPRCLVLDVQVKQLSSELAADLFDGASPAVLSEVRRTRRWRSTSRIANS